MASVRKDRWQRVFALVGEHRARLSVVATVSFISGLVEAAFLVVVTQVGFAVTQNDPSLDLLGRIQMQPGTGVALAAALVLVRAGLALCGVRLATGMALVVGISLKTRLARSFLTASWATQQNEPAGRLQQLVGGFAGSAVGVLNSFITAVTAGLSLAALLAVAVVINPAATLVALGAVLALGSTLAPLRSAIRRRSQRAAEVNLSATARITELGSLGLEMQTYGVRDAFVEQTEAAIVDESTTSRSTEVVRASVAPVYTSLGYIAIVGALAAATQWQADNLADIGAVMLVMLRSLGYGQTFQVATSNLVAAIPFLEIVDQTLERYEADLAPSGPVDLEHLDSITAHEVSFSYDGKTDVLRELTFRIERGEHIGIVGPSGSGKSTLVQLLLGLRNPSGGRLLVSDVDLTEVDRSTYAPRVAFVAQDAQLFAGSIEENIAFFRTGISKEQVERAALAARLGPDLEQMPDRLDTPVGERGTRLSGGQRQRVSIARALAGDPHMLVLDEPTSALDVHAEVAIREMIAGLRGRVTVVVIAHRLSTLEACDRVMVLQDGRMLAFAPANELVTDNAFYRDALALSNLK